VCSTGAGRQSNTAIPKPPSLICQFCQLDCMHRQNKQEEGQAAQHGIGREQKVQFSANALTNAAAIEL
jgi:hypothetical protein